MRSLDSAMIEEIMHRLRTFVSWPTLPRMAVRERLCSSSPSSVMRGAPIATSGKPRQRGLADGRARKQVLIDLRRWLGPVHAVFTGGNISQGATFNIKDRPIRDIWEHRPRLWERGCCLERRLTPREKDARLPIVVR